MEEMSGGEESCGSGADDGYFDHGYFTWSFGRDGVEYSGLYEKKSKSLFHQETQARVKGGSRSSLRWWLEGNKCILLIGNKRLF